MMEDLKHRFDDFGKDPSPEVWEKISASLDDAPAGSSFGKNKSLLTILAFAACLGIGFYAWTSNLDTKTNTTITEKSNIESSNETKRNTSHDEVTKRNTTIQDKDKTNENESLKNTDNKAINSHNKSLNKVAKLSENKTNLEENLNDNFHSNTSIKHKENKIVGSAISTESTIQKVIPLPRITSIKPKDNTLSENTNTVNPTTENEQEDTQTSQTIDSSSAVNTSINSQFTNDTKDLDLIALKPTFLPAVGMDYTKLSPCLYVIKNKKKWHHALMYRQGMIRYENNPPLNSVSDIESFSSAIIYEANHRPYSLTYEMSRKFSSKSGYTFLAGYQRDKAIYSQTDIELYAIHTNSVLLGAGYQIDLLKKRRWAITPGAVLFGIGSFRKRMNSQNVNAYDDAIPFASDEYISTTNTFEPSVKTELNIAVNYAITEKTSVTLMPFYQRSFLNYPGNETNAMPHQWGLGLGLKF